MDREEPMFNQRTAPIVLLIVTGLLCFVTGVLHLTPIWTLTGILAIGLAAVINAIHTVADESINAVKSTEKEGS